MMQRKREVAKWVFSKELKDTTFIEEPGEDERGRPYVITPLGTRMKRIMIAGTVTSRNVEENMTKLTVADPLGSFFLSVFPSEYSPEVKDTADQVENNSHVAVLGRVSPFKTEEGAMYHSINPESIFTVKEGTVAYWNWRTLLSSKRKFYAIREARKIESPEVQNLLDLGYYTEEAECAINSVKHYSDYDIQGFLESLSGISKSTAGSDKSKELKDLILDIIRKNDSDGKGCKYEQIVESGKEQQVEQHEIDEALNLLGSDGEIYEVSLKRYRII